MQWTGRMRTAVRCPLQTKRGFVGNGESCYLTRSREAPRSCWEAEPSIWKPPPSETAVNPQELLSIARRPLVTGLTGGFHLFPHAYVRPESACPAKAERRRTTAGI